MRGGAEATVAARAHDRRSHWQHGSPNSNPLLWPSPSLSLRQSACDQLRGLKSEPKEFKLLREYHEN